MLINVPRSSETLLNATLGTPPLIRSEGVKPQLSTKSVLIEGNSVELPRLASM